MSKKPEDFPLYGNESKEGLDLSTERISPEEERKNKTLDFGFNAVMALILFTGALVLIDIYMQRNYLNSDVVKSCISMATHLLTMIAGYIFANGEKK